MTALPFAVRLTAVQLCAAYKRVGVKWLEAILLFPGPLSAGKASVAPTKRLQELLVQAGERVEVDGGFGGGTTSALRSFQTKSGIRASGELDERTWDALVLPLVCALQVPDLSQKSVAEAAHYIALQHDLFNPHEIGGPNSGPWVRLYMQGNQGVAWPWCAGFVSFVLRQAALATTTEPTLGYTFSCDELAASAKKAARFTREGSPMAGSKPAIFLVRNAKNAMDWVHTGIGYAFEGAAFSTVEGNGNASGGREGVAVVQLKRGYRLRDFVTLPSTVDASLRSALRSLYPAAAATPAAPAAPAAPARQVLVPMEKILPMPLRVLEQAAMDFENDPIGHAFGCTS